MSWRLIVRAGPRVERAQFDELGAALDALESRARELAGAAKGRTIDVKVRSFEPSEQVSARLELAGPERFIATVRAGVDVRGDGSAEAYVGRLRREVVEQRKGETPYGALRRAVTSKRRK